ncbi:MAG: TlpA disulfide reductase family protein [Proteobacteria bacterium]|jgi:thiol-disulfide isomerase/thioredoxin|nr:TlpA disulfide reductase family protein [Pseudomonadota bacterium]MDA0971085.1 TlpA disulfide reductase family protein [Pseudomonadota bacterium]
MNSFTISYKKLTIFVFLFLLITNYCLSQQNIQVPFKNIVLHEKLKDLPVLMLEDKKSGKDVEVIFNKKITVINFWATWCAPCKEEMPSLDQMIDILGKDQVELIAVNVESISYEKSKSFLDELNIKNFDSLFDKELRVVKGLGLRGLPTTILINKQGKEFSRVVGAIDFSDKKFIDWIKNY